MTAYGPLAKGYDALTGDVPYPALADWYEAALSGGRENVRVLLDLCCGTGSLSMLLAERGYEMICTDASPDMLSVFQQKLASLPEAAPRPMLLCQRAEELDLYGTVDGCLCSLDAVNYLAPALLPELLRRLRLFIVPGGILAFDLLSPEHLRSLDGECFVDEEEGLLCLWRASLEGEELRYGLDLFRRTERGLWRREQEEHVEYLHDPEALRAQLEAAGFTDVRLIIDGPQHESGRLYFTARRA